MPKVEISVRDAMYEAAARNGEDGRRTYLGMSQIGDPCELRLWLEWRGYDPSRLDGRMRMLFSLGDRVEEEAIHWLEAAGYSVRDRQLSFEAVNGHFRGHCDGIVDGITSAPHILEVKSASASRWKSFEGFGVYKTSPTYYAQVQCYMRYAKLDRALFVIVNKNDSSLYLERMWYDSEAADHLEAKARRVMYLDRRPSPNVGHWCEFCRFTGHCKEHPYVQATHTCGTCSYLHCDGEKMTWECTNSKHMLPIVRWGIGCPDWTFRDALDEVPF